MVAVAAWAFSYAEILDSCAQAFIETEGTNSGSEEQGINSLHL